MGVIYITGTGIITGLGYGKDCTIEALRQHRSAIGKVRYLRTVHEELPVSEVPFNNDEMRDILGIQEDTMMTRTALIGRMALKEAMDEANINPSAQRTVFINGTTVGGMDRTEMFEKDFIKTHDCGTCTEMIAGENNGFSLVSTISTACSSAANAIILGKELINTGRADIAIVGGAECITRFHLNGFNTLMILDKDACRPFDKTHAGLNLGEGAGYIVLESESSVKKRNAKPLAVLSGTANRCDAYHQTASSPDGEGAYLAMKDALTDAGLNPSDISYINAHGTGTNINDMSEGMAIMRAFDKNIPPVASVKGFIGHTTSAAGGVEAVISILSLKYNYLPINLNFNEKIDELTFEPIHEETPHKEVVHVMSNSFGFGGNDTVCVFSKYIGSTSIDGQAHTSIHQPIKIASAAQISIQKPLCNDWFENPIHYEDSTLVKSQDPDYKPFINPMAARRMGLLLKRAIVTSKVALDEANVEQPDAIITATGMGCIENTDKFLQAMTEQGETCLQPTFFINSTHNTIGSTIAVLTKNHGYNNTHVHQGISFESALLDAVMQFDENKISSALVSAYDEMTERIYDYGTAALFNGNEGIVSDTAVSFVLNKKDGIELSSIEIMYKPDFEDITKSLNKICSQNRISIKDIDIVVTGRNNNPSNNIVYDNFERQFGFDGKSVGYKDCFGESFTSSAMGFYFAIECLRRGMTPNGIKTNRILVYNHFNNINHTLILLKR